MAKYRKLYPRFWKDENGVKHKTPSAKRRLSFSKFLLHRRLRAFVVKRDNATCLNCGERFSGSLTGYDGRYAIKTDGGLCLEIDHINPVAAEIINHPDNLRVLCERCNGAKGARLGGGP
jgi:5-methylcytosine-specific restriction endonuclease McrA